MTSAPPAGPRQAASFIRGGGGVTLKGGRLAATLWLLCVATLVAVTVLVGVANVNANASTQRLRRHGIPVVMTVTGCLAISSGVGMGIEYWKCRGAYTVGSRTYEETIGGQRSLLEAGQKIDVLADPGQPSLVSVPAALGHQHSYALTEVLAGITFAVLASGVGATLLVRRRRPSPQDRP